MKTFVQFVFNHLNSLIHMQPLEGDTFNVAELGQQLLITSERFVEGDEVHSDLAGVDEGEGDLGGVDASQVQANQEVAARVDFY